MPCDTTHNYENRALYQDILNDIKCICTKYGNIDYVIIGGDFNTDLNRTDSLHSQVLTEFVASEGLSLCLLSDVANVKYTYENESTCAESILDHFIISENLYETILEYRSVHDGHNLSDHAPIMIKLDINMVKLTDKVPRCYGKRPQWNLANEADIGHYKTVLHDMLAKISMPMQALYCNDIACKQHYTVIDTYYESIIDACLKASDMCIPSTKKRVIAGWNEVAEPMRNEAIFWHGIWIDNGRPKHGLVADIRRRTRAKYKLTVKKLKRDQTNSISEKNGNVTSITK